MASIIKKKNREGKVYIYLAESYRVGDKVRNRILKSYGKLDELEKEEPGILDRLRKEAKAGLLTEDASKKVQVELDLQKPIVADDKNYGWKILADIYQMLGIPYITKKVDTPLDIDSVLQLLTYQRILRPGSKFDAFSHQNDLWGKWDIEKNTVYRSLEIFNQLKEDIQLKIHNSIQESIGREATLVFYDVTNYYFEVDIDDVDDEFDEENKGMRRRGPSKEHRPKPIIQMGLFMDTNGIPISYRLFPGNQTDPITYIPAIEQVKKQFGIERIIVVADKAMNSKKNVMKTFKNNDGWLFSTKHRGKRGADKKIQAFILSEDGWEYNSSCTFAKKSMIRERDLGKDEDGIKQIVKEKVVVTWSEKYANREQIRRDGAIKYAEGLRNPEKFRASCKRGGKKYLEQYVIDQETGEMKKLSPFLGIDYDQVDFDAQFDGVNVLVSSEIEINDDEIISKYKELSRIEDCFRVTKTEFHARPVYVRRKESIEAHFLTCFIALVILRILQFKTNHMMSPERLIEALQSARANDVTKGYCRVQANEDLVQLHKVLGIDWEYAHVKSEKIEHYAKGWCTT
jgi:transposase